MPDAPSGPADPEHLRRLERMYLAAPVNRHFRPEIEIRDGEAEIRMAVREDFFHAARAVHGSVYFKALDDAAFFAVNSRVEGFLVLTSGFHCHFVRPASKGELRSVGRVVSAGRRLFVAEASLYDGGGRLLAAGSGSFLRSRIPLDEAVGYA